MDFKFSGQRIRESTGTRSRTLAARIEDKRRRELKAGTAGIRNREQPRLLSAAAEEWQEAKKRKVVHRDAGDRREQVGAVQGCIRREDLRYGSKQADRRNHGTVGSGEDADPAPLPAVRWWHPNGQAKASGWLRLRCLPLENPRITGWPDRRPLP
jgi:hypothetical protein